MRSPRTNMLRALVTLQPENDTRRLRLVSMNRSTLLHFKNALRLRGALRPRLTDTFVAQLFEQLAGARLHRWRSRTHRVFEKVSYRLEIAGIPSKVD